MRVRQKCQQKRFSSICLCSILFIYVIQLLDGVRTQPISRHSFGMYMHGNSGNLFRIELAILNHVKTIRNISPYMCMCIMIKISICSAFRIQVIALINLMMALFPFSFVEWNSHLVLVKMQTVTKCRVAVRTNPMGMAHTSFAVGCHS